MKYSPCGGLHSSEPVREIRETYIGLYVVVDSYSGIPGQS
jgi:hypothetical protein